MVYVVVAIYFGNSVAYCPQCVSHPAYQDLKSGPEVTETKIFFCVNENVQI
jgi:hypothetical protein